MWRCGVLNLVLLQLKDKLPQDVGRSLPAAYAVTGCDVSFKIGEHSKATEWKGFQKQPDLLASLYEKDVTHEVHDQIKHFLVYCMVYLISIL